MLQGYLFTVIQLPKPNSLLVRKRRMDFRENSAQVITEFPVRIMALKLPNVADPPDMITNPIRFFIAPLQFASADLLAKIDRLKHRTIRVATPADVVNFTCARRGDKFLERFDQIDAVNVIADLFPFVSEHAIRATGHRTNHQVGEKSMQLRTGVRRASQATAAK